MPRSGPGGSVALHIDALQGFTSKRQQPASSGESDHSPRTGFSWEPSDSVAQRCGASHHPGYDSMLTMLQHRPVQYGDTHADAAALFAAAPAAADPVKAIKQGLASMGPTELAELQAQLRQQRLQRQQQDLLPLVQGVPPQAALSGCQYTTPCSFPQQQQGGAPTATHAVSMMRQVALAVNSLGMSAGFAAPAQDDVALLALLKGAAAQLLLQQHEQQHSAALVPAAPPVPTQAQQQQQQQSQVQQQTQQQEQQHPGIAPCKAARNTVRSRGSWQTAPQTLVPSLQQAPNPAAVDVTASAAQDVHANAATGVAATVACSSSSALTGRFGRLPPQVQAALLQQLQELEDETARLSEAAAAPQRRSNRRKAPKRDWDSSNNQHRGSPDAAADAAAAAAAATGDRAGSADANNNSSTSTSDILQDAHAPISQQLQQLQQQQPVVKRVRFALADDAGSEHEEEEKEQWECHPKLVRRIGVRAQARKRMHKRTARRRRPMRAPLS